MPTGSRRAQEKRSQGRNAEKRFQAQYSEDDAAFIDEDYQFSEQ
jgi:hypothetical protein